MERSPRASRAAASFGLKNASSGRSCRRFITYGPPSKVALRVGRLGASAEPLAPSAVPSAGRRWARRLLSLSNQSHLSRRMEPSRSRARSGASARERHHGKMGRKRCEPDRGASTAGGRWEMGGARCEVRGARWREVRTDLLIDLPDDSDELPARPSLHPHVVCDDVTLGRAEVGARARREHGGVDARDAALPHDLLERLEARFLRAVEQLSGRLVESVNGCEPSRQCLHGR